MCINQIKHVKKGGGDEILKEKINVLLQGKKCALHVF